MGLQYHTWLVHGGSSLYDPPKGFFKCNSIFFYDHPFLSYSDSNLNEHFFDPQVKHQVSRD